jgi:diguanylate cyclase (GGDEF)-like protein
MKQLKIGQFFGFLLLIFTVFYLLRTWYYYNITRMDVQTIVYQNIRNTLLEAQDRIKSELNRDDPHYSTLRNLITRLENNNDMIEKLSFIQNNKVVFSSDPKDIGEFFDINKASSILDTTPAMIFDTPVVYFGNTYRKDGKLAVFYVIANISKAYTSRLFYEKMKHFFFFSGFVPIFLILLIWWMLRKMVISPLEEIEKMVKQRNVENTPYSLLQEINDLGQVLKETFIQLKRQIDALDYMARYDMLTGLPNRHSMQEHIDTMIHRTKEKNISFALLYLDLDHFKQINDTEGHDVGDKILRTVSSRLKKIIEKEDIVGRIGGDEFLYCTLETDEDALLLLVQRINQILSKPISYNSKEYRLGVSIGIARSPKDGNDRITLIKHADIALYEAKRQGRNRAIFFDDELAQVLMQEAALSRDMEKALQAGDFNVYYQPQVEVDSGKIIGFEALMRWKHPEQGMIPPDIFIPLAEKNGFIFDLGHFVLEKACRTIKTLEHLGYDMIVSVNLSTVQIRQELIEEIDQLVLSYGIRKEKLHLEITETVLMENFDENIKTLHALNNAGYIISLDDFGTGYSSLAYLRMMPVHILKIDKSFIMQLGSQKDDRALVEGIIALGHALDLKVVAEGVETEDNLIFLQESRCDIYQGYFFSPPVSWDILVEKYL